MSLRQPQYPEIVSNRHQLSPCYSQYQILLCVICPNIIRPVASLQSTDNFPETHEGLHPAVEFRLRIEGKDTTVGELVTNIALYCVVVGGVCELAVILLVLEGKDTGRERAVAVTVAIPESVACEEGKLAPTHIYPVHSAAVWGVLLNIV